MGPPGLEVVEFAALERLDGDAVSALERAFCGEAAYGVVGVRGVPGYAAARRAAFEGAVDLAVRDAEGRERCAAVRQTYPGWNGAPGRETHPLQSNFLHNIKEDVGAEPAVDTFYGRNAWPDKGLKRRFVRLNECMYPTALRVLRGLDDIVGRALGRATLESIASDGTTLAGRWIWYDSRFSRDDDLLDQQDDRHLKTTAACQQQQPATEEEEEDGLASMRTQGTNIRTTGAAEDGLASMRTQGTKIRTTGAAEDGLASMRTQGTKIWTTDAAEDGLASMRTQGTKIRTTGAAEDGLASMRTQGTKIRTTGAAEDGLASMRTQGTKIRTTGAAEDGLASMRTQGTEIRTTDAAEDGLASMRTQGMKIQTTGGAEEEEDGLASMRTQGTKIRTTGLPEGDDDPQEEEAEELRKTGTNDEMGAFWLPWHIDSQFVTLLTCDDYFDEATGARRSDLRGRPSTGLAVMNRRGDVAEVSPVVDDEVMLLQMGGFGQLWTGGRLVACRHAVMRRAAAPGVARAIYCNFWYAPWTKACTLPEGATVRDAVNAGWNAMMDASYVDVTMRLSFQRFRDHFAATPVGRERPDSSFRALARALPAPHDEGLTLDILTDLRCPYSHLALKALNEALLLVEGNPPHRTRIFRFHPVYLEPDKEEPEALEAYYARALGISPAQLRAGDYALYRKGLAKGVTFSANRRVVPTRAFFQALRALAVPENGSSSSQEPFFHECSRRYFEEGTLDPSDPDELCAVAHALNFKLTVNGIRSAEGATRADYEALAPLVPRVPHVVLRRADGHGCDLVGARSVADYEAALQSCCCSTATEEEVGPSAGASFPGLWPPPGVVVRGIDGDQVRLEFADGASPISLHARARRGFVAEKWPYGAEDFSRAADGADDSEEPNFHWHLDAACRAALTRTYRALFSSKRQQQQQEKQNLRLVDLCSSHASHLPSDMAFDRVVAHGLNAQELEANGRATEVVVQDLNKDPKLPFDDGAFDVATNVSSLAYLTDPRTVVQETHRLLRPGGIAVFAFSNRCFEAKARRQTVEMTRATRVWLRDAAVGAALVDHAFNFLHFGAPWAHVATVDVSPSADSDPLWLLVAVK